VEDHRIGASFENRPRPAPVIPASLLYVLLLFSLNGCFSSREEIGGRSPREWTRRECLTVILSSTATNMFDNTVSAWMIAVPYLPSVVEAIVRLDELEDTLNTFESKYKFQLDALMKQGSGLYYDWEGGKYYSPRGRYFREKTDIDSLLFLVTVINRGYPIYAPALDSLETKITLSNDRGERISPRYVWGKKNANLMNEEHLFVMFDLGPSGEKHFFKDQEYVCFELDLDGTMIRSQFSLKFVG
jgi:hypothetical protein